MCKVHIILQELQAVTQMLPKMAFHLSGKVVALQVDNSTAKANLCNQNGKMSLFLPKLSCLILNMAKKYCITLIPEYIPTHLIEADYLLWDRVVPE